MTDCIFCKIVKKELQVGIEMETETLLAFKDINPKAPVHILIIPKKHIQDITEANEGVWDEIGRLAKEIAREKNLKGFRIVHNAGEAAAIPHMHVHLLGEVSAERAV